ncbi:hypothetical protein LCGC14_1655520 [marine sediment metagenome]|uniref:Uncharacterized protein n=1 Tax=marine sediment metagenome TaxID=412755 RepID=A0A0F9HW83_9ZZZZ
MFSLLLIILIFLKICERFYVKSKVNLKDKVKKLDCLLSFQASTDIDFRLHRLTFEADLLDFQIDAEYNAKKNSKLWFN